MTNEASPNPWLTQPRARVQDVVGTPPVAAAKVAAPRMWPQPDSVLAPTGGLGYAHPHSTVPGVLTWVGCHGGAGVTTLERAVPGGRDGARMWPGTLPGVTVPVVLVCRSHISGLLAAQTAIRQWAAGAVPGVDLLGLAILADAPGSMPRPIKDLAKLVRGGVPRSWLVPWVEPWRLGEPPTHHMPRQLKALAEELAPHLTRIGEQS